MKAEEEEEEQEEGGIPLSREMQAISVTGSIADDSMTHEYAYGAQKAGQGEWQEVRSGTSWKSPSRATLSASSRFNLKACEHPSAPSIAASAHTFSTGVADRSNAGDIRPNGWAKIKAYKPPVITRANPYVSL